VEREVRKFVADKGDARCAVRVVAICVLCDSAEQMSGTVLTTSTHGLIRHPSCRGVGRGHVNGSASRIAGRKRYSPPLDPIVDS
jgi:hypothetical protein